jgi:hypothetical protein
MSQDPPGRAVSDQPALTFEVLDALVDEDPIKLRDVVWAEVSRLRTELDRLRDSWTSPEGLRRLSVEWQADMDALRAESTLVRGAAKTYREDILSMVLKALGRTDRDKPLSEHVGDLIRERDALRAPVAEHRRPIDFEAACRTITHDWMRHLGFGEKDIAISETPPDHSACAPTDDQGGLYCIDEDGEYIHPIHHEANQTAALVMFVLEHDALAAVDALPSTPREKER